MYIYIHDRVQRSNAVVYRVVEYKPTQRGVSCNMDRSKRAGIGQWHEYDHVACNKRIMYVYYMPRDRIHASILYWQSGTTFINSSACKDLSRIGCLG